MPTAATILRSRTWPPRPMMRFSSSPTSGRIAQAFADSAQSQVAPAGEAVGMVHRAVLLRGRQHAEGHCRTRGAVELDAPAALPGPTRPGQAACTMNARPSGGAPMELVGMRVAERRRAGRRPAGIVSTGSGCTRAPEDRGRRWCWCTDRRRLGTCCPWRRCSPSASPPTFPTCRDMAAASG